jgi:hypothetical protein
MKTTEFQLAFLSPGVVEDTRLGMASTIRELLVELADLKSQITNATIDAEKKDIYVLTTKSTEKFLLLLQSVLLKLDLNALFANIFEVKDLIQDAIFLWNSNNPIPLSEIHMNILNFALINLSQPQQRHLEILSSKSRSLSTTWIRSFSHSNSTF